MLRMPCRSCLVLIAAVFFAALLAVPVAAASQEIGTLVASPASTAGATMIFAGIRGRVVAFDRNNGKEVWSTHLSGGDFVNVVFLGESLYASTRGEIFCLEAATGKVRWHNALKGYGRGLMTIAASGIAENQGAVVSATKRRKEQQQHAASAVAIQPIK